MINHGYFILGNNVDVETRCAHYHKEIDRIAIKFYCCQTYYPCYECHDELGCGETKQWPSDQFHTKAILCGACGYELTVSEYLTCHSSCPNCQSPFNPGCSLHAHLYFDV